MVDRLHRSWGLAAACWRLLLQDKRLLVFPLLSALAIVVLIASFALPLATFAVQIRRGAAQSLSTLTLLALFAFYWLQLAIVIFFNTALVAAAMKRFDGEQAGVGDGLRRAFALLPAILAYAAIAAFAGTLLRIVAERVGFIGRIVIGLIGFAWSVATALVVPVLATESLGPLDAIGRSVALIKKAWGEDIIGAAGIGVVFVLSTVVTLFAGGFLVVAALVADRLALAAALFVLLILSVCLLALANATLQGIYSAALYRYASGDPNSGGIDKNLLEGAFRARA